VVSSNGTDVVPPSSSFANLPRASSQSFASTFAPPMPTLASNGSQRTLWLQPIVADVDGEATRFCQTCNCFRPPQTKHCRYCDCCIQEFDHHCPWVGTCIGRRNYRYFVAYVILVTLFASYILIFTTIQIVQKTEKETGESWGDQLYAAMRDLPASCALFIYALLALLSVASLLAYHVNLICLAQTTNEKIRGTFSAVENPFDNGFVQNCHYVCCSPIPKSLLR